MLAGDHFFIHSAKPQLLGALDCVLHQYIHTTNSSSQQETLILPEAF
jgi:surfactin synthase thioesterase subunit